MAPSLLPAENAALPIAASPPLGLANARQPANVGNIALWLRRAGLGWVQAGGVAHGQGG
jgi:hypothetical protein